VQSTLTLIDAEELKSLSDIERTKYIDYRSVKARILAEGYRPTIIIGDYGFGKTHLLKAIGSELIRRGFFVIRFRVGYAFEYMRRSYVEVNELIRNLLEYVVSDLARGPPYGPIHIGNSPVDFIDNLDEVGVLSQAKSLIPSMKEIVKSSTETRASIHELVLAMCRLIEKLNLKVALLWDQFEPLIEVPGLDWRGLSTFFNHLTSRSHEEHVKVVVAVLPILTEENKLSFERWLSYQRGILSIYVLDPLQKSDVRYILRSLLPMLRSSTDLEELVADIVTKLVWSSRNPGSIRALYEALMKLRLHEASTESDVLRRLLESTVYNEQVLRHFQNLLNELDITMEVD